MLRQLPRKSRIIREVRHGSDRALADHALDRGPHEDRLVEIRMDIHPLGSHRRMMGSSRRTEFTTVTVEASACLKMDKIGGALAVHVHHVFLLGVAVFNVGYVAKQNFGIAHVLSRATD